MITSEKYTILDSVSHKINETTQLCILNFNIIQVPDLTKKLINSHPNTIFWLATNDFSKQNILYASKLGIKNVIQTPIKTELIEDFFQTKSNIKDNNLNYIYKPLKQSSILIVDDNELNIKLLEDTLYDLEIKIISCSNPTESLKYIKEFKFNLILLDILMPEISGFELAEIIKQSSLNNSTPIIFISAVSGTENILNGYNMGAYSYIEKPFHPNIVKSQIYNLLKTEENKISLEKEQENFVATLTHDLKSPINAEITALNYLLKDNPTKDKPIQKEMLSELLNSAKYMKLITDRILAHYKQKNTDLILNKEICSLKEIVISCINELNYLTTEKNLQIRLFSEPDNYLINIDYIEIKRVINNLLSNAIEYSNKNSYIDITLAKDNDKYIFKIKDYGLGIDLEKYNCVFDEYMTLSKNHKKVGFGLGLNICKSIINAHNGDISISSQPQKGTEITFTLPI